MEYQRVHTKEEAMPARWSLLRGSSSKSKEDLLVTADMGVYGEFRPEDRGVCKTTWPLRNVLAHWASNSSSRDPAWPESRGTQQPQSQSVFRLVALERKAGVRGHFTCTEADPASPHH